MQDEETPGNAKQAKRLAKKAKRDDKQASKVPKNEKKFVANPVLRDADVEVAPSDDENPSFNAERMNPSFEAEATVE